MVRLGSLHVTEAMTGCRSCFSRNPIAIHSSDMMESEPKDYLLIQSENDFAPGPRLAWKDILSSLDPAPRKSRIPLVSNPIVHA